MRSLTRSMAFTVALQVALSMTLTNVSNLENHRVSSRLMITFFNSSDNNTTNVDLNGAIVVKQYGRRLLLDLNEPFDLDTQRDLWMTKLKNVEMVEVDGIASVSYGIFFPPWNFKDNEEFSVKVEEVLNNPIDNRDVVVAVLDTGIAEIAKVKFWGLRNGYDFVSSVYVSKDGDGRDADATDPGDGGATCTSTWHGTSVSSIIGAIHNGPVVRGIAPYCTLLSIRIGGECGTATFSDMADAIVWAAGGRIDGVPDNPARAHIISLSYVGESACSSYLQSAINQAVDLGSLVIVAAGNDAFHVSRSAPTNCENVVSVAANGKDGLLAPYSNWGATVTAPGGSSRRGDLGLEVWSVNQEKTQVVNVITIGTSFAAPHVAALASLIKHDPVNTIQKQFNRYISGRLNANPPQVLVCRGDNCAGELITWPKLKLITACETCPQGQYRVECDGISPGRCANCEACPSGKYRTGCSWMSPGVCTDCALQCPSDQYVSTECGGTSPGVCGSCYGVSYCDMSPLVNKCISPSYACLECQACPAGKYRKQVCFDRYEACTPCLSCPLGQYLNWCGDLNGGSCVPCPSCPPGEYLAGCGNLQSGSCIACPSCPSGQYRSTRCGDSSPGQCSPCAACPAGQYNVECGNSSAGRCVTCQACPAGKYLKDCMGTSPGVCTDCALQCPSGKYVSTECGGTSPGVCGSCHDSAPYCGMPPLFNKCISPWNACFECPACPAGKYRKQVCFDRYEACTLCPSCPVGKYRNGCDDLNEGSCVSCPTCPSGQYRDGCSGLNSGSCISCPSCPSGQYRSGCSGLNSGSCISCPSCPEGQYRDGCSGLNSGSCISCPSCPEGQYRTECSGLNSGMCIPCQSCPDWQYRIECSNLTSGTCISCQFCPPGYFRVGCTYLSPGECSPCSN